MEERRGKKRHPVGGGSVWIGAPHEGWATLVDISSSGLALEGGPRLRIGQEVIIRRKLGRVLSEARVGLVVYGDAGRVGIRWIADRQGELTGDRRRSLRRAIKGVRAWIHGAANTPAAVVDVSATGLRLEPLIPLRRGSTVLVALFYGETAIGSRRAVVVRSDEDGAAVRLIASGADEGAEQGARVAAGG
jgi:hypothetical protein